MKKEINALLACAASALMLASPAFGEDGYIESDGTQYIKTSGTSSGRTRRSRSISR